MTVIDEEDYLAHYGILRKSGRYPWGSGDDVTQRSKSFTDHVQKLKSQGLTEVQIAQGFGMTITELRQTKTIAKNAQKQSNIDMAQRLKEKGYSNVAIGKRMEIPESSVRALLAPGLKDKNDILSSTTNMLRSQVDQKEYVDIGKGVENHLLISKEKLNAAVSVLEEEGYKRFYVKEKQLGTGNMTTIKVLARPDKTFPEVAKDHSKIKTVGEFSEDGGRTFDEFQPPISISSKRLGINWKEDGGDQADGVVYVRPGVDDITLGHSNYAQVRVAIDGTHYIKGMAVYKDDLPDGVDLQFNTVKPRSSNKLDALKEMKTDPSDASKIDPTSPFGAVVDQIHKTDPAGNILRSSNGKPILKSSMNIVSKEGDWEGWTRDLSSQMLSKQSPKLAKQQLDATYQGKKDGLDEILSLTNPAVRSKLLEGYADSLDSSAVHLEAAAMPRQGWHVILPVNSLKETEVYAPNFRDGERVALIRYPHGGIFEIPELQVNNRNPEARKIIGPQAKDAIGINNKVAAHLSGADFDGDTVIVIPNNAGQIKSSPALAGLKNFDPQSAYPAYEGMPKIKPKIKQTEMGKVSNLITDMTIGGASPEELARAVRHSMVVIDSEKKHLNYKKSAIDNGIAALKEKYQGGKRKGAATLISRAGSPVRVLKRGPRLAAEGGPIDPATGKKMFRAEPEHFINKQGEKIYLKRNSTKLAETEDAFSLVSSARTPMETLYANHSNKLKGLANTARKELFNTPPAERSPSAAKAYAREVDSLNAKLNIALRNAPLERQAQLLANTMVSARRQANPEMDSASLKKIESQSLITARHRTGAEKQDIMITDSEWDAIQAGAISNNKLRQILDKSNLERVKKLATPKSTILMTSVKQQRAASMLASGYTQAQVADALGVSLSTLKSSIR